MFKKIVYGFLVILLALSVYLYISVKQPYGIIALGFVVGGLLSMALLKIKWLRVSLVVIFSSAGLYSVTEGCYFMLDTNFKRQKFNIETAVHFEKNGFEDALAKSKQENKYIFVDFYTGWCPPCLHMVQHIFTDDQVGDAMNETFVNLKYDAEKGAGVELAKRYNVRGYPTCLVLDSEGNVVEKVGGNLVPRKDDLIAVAKKYKRH